MGHQEVVALWGFSKKVDLSHGLKDERAIHTQRKSETDNSEQRQGPEVGLSFA